MVREEFSFDSRDGVSKIHAVKWMPDCAPRAVLQITHGMAEHYERYETFAQFMTEHGFVVTADDHLGHGKTAMRNGGKRGYICKDHSDTVMVRDEHRLKKTVQAQYPDLPYFVLGHSMGSFIIRNYMYRYGSGINGAIVMGTGAQPKGLLVVSRCLAAIEGLICGDDHESAFLNKLAFGAYNKRFTDTNHPSAWLTRDPEIHDSYTRDDNCGFIFTVNGFKTLFKLIWNLTITDNIAKMPKNLPVFLVSGEQDPVGEYGAAVRRVYDSYIGLGMSDVTMKLYADDRHEVLNELDKDQVYADILAWLEAHI